MRRLTHLLIAMACLLPAAALQAQENPRFNADLYRPSLHPGDILGIQTSNQPGHLKVGGGLFLTWNHKPLAIVDQSTGNVLLKAVTNQFVGDLFVSLGLSDYLDLALGLPVFLYTTGDEPNALSALKKAEGVSVGDLRFGAKVSFFGRQRKAGFGLALAEDLTFPTATPKDFNGDRLVTSTTTLVADYLYRGWNVAVNLGYRFRPNVRVPDTAGGYWIGDELLVGAGLVVPFICGKLEGIGTMEFRGGIENEAFSKYSTGLDFLGGIRGRVGPVALLAAAGGGALKGYGSPAYRVTLGVSYEPAIDRGCVKDTDKDGICDEKDKCPTIPGPAETEGCPDRDRDGILDADDRCPDVPGLEKFQGCPDQDGDGIEDSKDRCPKEPGPAKFDGCPDKDGDGIPDLKDKCPDQPGPEATGGCPDKDGDGIADGEDKCPDIPGRKELQGCPPPTPEKVRLTAERIEILEMVFFDTNKATIKPVSFGILDAVAQVLQDNPFIKRLQVAGHTDDVGPDDKNLKLSQARAEAVRAYLISKGVAPERLEAVGFGETKPLVPEKTKEARAKNRRVEFLILEK